MNKEKAKIIYDALDEKKANRISVIDIEKISVLADCFMIADGENKNQVQAMADNVEEEMLKAGYHCKSITGYQSGSWILMDYQDIVVHIFGREDRMFYDLERLWRDGRQVQKEELMQEKD
ncbi:MAG: ribosome silencing factor [Lachnospiraceae bacterium]|nr:ribosome silencing factor [Lachnospiraceae bacterium]